MTPRTLDGLCRIGTLFFVVVGLSTLARSAVVFVPLPEEFLWLHILENEEENISPKLDFDGDGTGDLMFASGYGGVVLYTGRNVRLVTVGGVTSNAPEGTILNHLSRNPKLDDFGLSGAVVFLGFAACLLVSWGLRRQLRRSCSWPL